MTTNLITALPIKTTPLLPPMEKEPQKATPVFAETEPTATPETEWETNVRKLEAELAELEKDPDTTAVSYYKFFEAVRGLISYAYASYSDSTALTVVGKLTSLKEQVSPRIIRS